MRLVRFSSLRLPPCRLTVVYVRTTSPRPALSMYGTPARFRMIFFRPWLTRLLTLSLSSSSPSPNVILPLTSSSTTSPTVRSSICMETLQIKVSLTAAQTPPAPANFRDWKHSLQKTGRPCVGLNGTVVSLPQAEHMDWVWTRSRTALAPTGRAARLPLQALHRFGSFLKFLSAKNCCSPAVQMNSAPQSTQFKILSWNSIDRYLVGRSSYSSSRRSFFRLRLRASACLARRLSPGFKYNEC